MLKGMTSPISHSRILQAPVLLKKPRESKVVPQEGLAPPSESVTLGGASSGVVELPKAFQQIGISAPLLEQFAKAKRAYVPTGAQGPLSVALYFALDKLDQRSQLSDMQGRELDYVSALNSAQKFSTLEEGLQEQDVSLARHYTDARSGLAHFHAQLDEHLDQKGVVPGRLPLLLQARSNEPLSEDNRELLNDSVGRLAHQFFGDVSEDKQAMKFFLGTFTRQLAENGKENPEEALTLKETHQLLSHMTAAVFHQERAANETPIGDHGIDHLIKHNVNWVQGTFDQLQQKGVPITAKDRLLGSLVMVYHDLGYTAPSVVESVDKVGIRGQDKGHGAIAARYVRELSEQSGTPFQKLLKPEDWNLFHRGVLYHDRTQEALPVEKFIVTENPTQEERVHNFESAIRLADNAHGFSSKVSKPLAKNPESLKFLRMMQVAKDLEKDGLETGGFTDSFFKEKLGESWSKLGGVLPERLLRGGEKLTELLSPVEAKFISGRLMDADPLTQVRADGGVHVVFPSGQNPMREFGVADEPSQQSKMLADIDPRAEDGASSMVEVSYLPLTENSQSDFMQELGKIFLDDESFKAFNRIENSARVVAGTSSQVLQGTGRAPAPDEWLSKLASDPILEDPKLRRAYDALSASDADPLDKVAAFRATLQRHRTENFARYCRSVNWT